jgi:hypothetical protein
MCDFPYIQCLGRHIEQNDIDVFYNKSKKSENDLFNKIRESIIVNYQDIPRWPIHSENKEKWSDIYTNIGIVIDELLDNNEYKKIEIIHKAGRGNNHDFLLIADLVNGKRIERIIEFKCNSIPQISSIYCSNQLFSAMSYIDYFYDNWLTKIVGKSHILPERSIYIKDITKTKPEQTKSVDFFRWLKENPNNKLVNESIRQFLVSYKDKLDLASLSNYFLDTQKEKTFIVWNTTTREFTIKPGFTNDDLTLLRVDNTILNNNTLVVYSKNFRFKFLLRWKNHKGCLGPAWQISVDKIKND